MANYWEDPQWAAQAVRAELSVQPLLTRRRWTDKDIIAANAVYWPEWPIIPKGIGADFEGERALRVFLEITDGPEAHEAPPEAVLVAKLSGDDAARAGLKKDDVFLVVPLKFFAWVAGALSFEKKVLLKLSVPIMERRLEHDDAEDTWPELAWIAPMKEADRKYYYAVLPLVGMGGVIDPQKGNPSFYAPIQTDPYRHIVWQVVDEIIDGGISEWGQGAASGDGAASIFRIKLRLVNFLRDLADRFKEEELRRKQRRGDLSLRDINKAFSDGLYRHLPDDERIARENELLERFHREVQVPRARRLSAPGVLSWSYSDAAKLVASSYGEWAGPARADLERDRWFDLAWRVSRSTFLKKVGRVLALGYADPELSGKLAEKALDAYFGGEISLRELAIFADESPFGRIISALIGEEGFEVGADQPWIDEHLVEHDPEVDYILGGNYHG